ncbi:hypothetical protein GOBAR_DD03228 [Gossypium barbadense]|nr:hypothetical protein GOBAR_DD03228 [Gossypium barbadense]
MGTPNLTYGDVNLKIGEPVNASDVGQDNLELEPLALHIGTQFPMKEVIVLAIQEYNVKTFVAYRVNVSTTERDATLCSYDDRIRPWLAQMEVEQWAQCFDGGRCYGHTTTNLAEATNSILKRTHHLHINGVVKETYYRMSLRISLRGLATATGSGVLSGSWVRTSSTSNSSIVAGELDLLTGQIPICSNSTCFGVHSTCCGVLLV